MPRIAVAAVLVASLSSLALAQPGRGGLPPCAPSTEKHLGADDAKGCWLKAAHGSWRILERDGHYDSAVYHVGAEDVQDAEQIAKAIVAGDGTALGELLVYVYREPVGKSSGIRRVSWAKKAGRYEMLDLPGRAPEWIVPAQP